MTAKALQIGGSPVGRAARPIPVVAGSCPRLKDVAPAPRPFRPHPEDATCRPRLCPYASPESSFLNPTGWLYAIARHVLSDSLARGRVEDSVRRELGLRRLSLDDEAITSIEGLIGDVALAALDRLPEDQRIAVRGRVLGEAEYEALAKALPELQPDPAHPGLLTGHELGNIGFPQGGVFDRGGGQAFKTHTRQQEFANHDRSARRAGPAWIVAEGGTPSQRATLLRVLQTEA